MEDAATLTVAIVQRDLTAKNHRENLAGFEMQLRDLPHDVDVILLPEMFPSGFIADTIDHVEPAEGPSRQWMKSVAKERNALVCGSIATQDGEKYYNRFYLMYPSGTAECYDKQHLFPLAEEEKIFTPGNTRVIVNYKGWRILPQVCYDLRFPETARNHNDYDLLLYTASWPAARSFAWNTLLKARAIENQCFLAACNRIGTDPQGITYQGNSMLLAPNGSTLGELPMHTAGIITATLKKQMLTDFRQKYPFLPNREK